MKSDKLQTPDEAFLNLPHWPYEPNYVEDLEGFEGLRIHYIDVKKGDSPTNHTFLCLHGQPTWSYIYRKMIPVFLESNARVIAPDFLGFGRSDKPTNENIYTYDFHRNMLLALIKRLKISNITLVVQDWGGVLGLTLPMTMPERFSRLLIMNTVLPIGNKLSKGFEDWLSYSNSHPDLDVSRLMLRTTPILTEIEAKAYDAPFPDIRYKAGVRKFPKLVMTKPWMDGVSISQSALKFLKNEWTGKSFLAMGMKDSVLNPDIMKDLHSNIKNCPPALQIPEGGHFLQEWGNKIAKLALEYWSEF